MNIQTYAFRISNTISRQNGHPARFVGKVLRETPKAIYIYGRGSTHFASEGVCCNCGRQLTHPVSVVLGIGPECGGHYHMPSAALKGAVSVEEVAKLTKILEEVVIDGWFPLSMVREQEDCSEIVEVPADHKMLSGLSATTSGRSSAAIPNKSNIPKQVPSIRRRATIDNGRFVIEFSYDPNMVARAKTLSGRKWDPDTKRWSAPLCIENAERIMLFPDFEKSVVKKWLDLKRAPAKIVPVKVPGMKRPLMPFQEDSVAFGESRKGRYMIGDVPGLGKTCQQLAFLQLHPELRPAVVTCPSSAKYVYRNEAKLVMSSRGDTHVINGEYKKGDILPESDIYIINYDILSVRSTCPVCKGTKKVPGPAGLKKCSKCRGKGKLVRLRPDLAALSSKIKAVLADEFHYLQDPTSDRTLSFKELAKNCECLIPSSGTPIRKRPKSAFTILNMLRPDIFHSWWDYAKKFCGATHNGYGWDFNGASNVEELHELLKMVMIRRTKKQVLPQLPKIQRGIVPLQLSNAKEYHEADTNFLRWLREVNPDALSGAENAEALGRINALRQLSTKGKVNSAIKWIEDFLESGEKLILFAHHKEIVQQLSSYFKDICVVIDGNASAAQKSERETLFQACVNCGIKKDKHDDEACEKYEHNHIQLLIGTLAAKEALTLTAASDVAFIEFWWSPKDHEQAEERAYGRISDPHGANAHYLTAEHTIDEDFLEMLDKCRAVIDAIIDGETIKNSDSLAGLLRNLRQKKELHAPEKKAERLIKQASATNQKLGA